MNRLALLENAANKFVSSIESLPENLFLAPLHDWTPRDIAAHLTWWNNNMLVACRDLQKGKAPTYYADTLNDYRHINARAVAQFAERDRYKLLAQLKATLFEFKEYLAVLDPQDWDADHRVTHPRGGAATISRIVESLKSDYETHTQQIKDMQMTA